MLGALLDALPGAEQTHCVLRCSELCTDVRTYGRTDEEENSLSRINLTLVQHGRVYGKF